MYRLLNNLDAPAYETDTPQATALMRSLPSFYHRAVNVC